MKKSALTVHEKAVTKIQKQADKSLEKFRKTELDIIEANNELHGVVTAIDIEMDKLAALRIKTQQQIKANDTVLSSLAPLLGKGN
jgi:hypothetical protein